MRFRFSPARPADAEQPLAHALETADRAEEGAVERGVNSTLDSNPFKLNPSYTRRLRRKMIEAVGCGIIGGIGITMTIAIVGTSAHWSVTAIAGFATGFVLGRAVAAARTMLAFQSLDRVNAQTLSFALSDEQLKSFGLACELNAARHETNMIYTAYLFSVAAEAGAAPADGHGQGVSPSADVLYLKPKTVH
jgi:hypothetical protein